MREFSIVSEISNPNNDSDKTNKSVTSFTWNLCMHGKKRKYCQRKVRTTNGEKCRWQFVTRKTERAKVFHNILHKILNVFCLLIAWQIETLGTVGSVEFLSDWNASGETKLFVTTIRETNKCAAIFQCKIDCNSIPENHWSNNSGKVSFYTQQ